MLKILNGGVSGYTRIKDIQSRTKLNEVDGFFPFLYIKETPSACPRIHARPRTNEVVSAPHHTTGDSIARLSCGGPRT